MIDFDSEEYAELVADRAVKRIVREVFPEYLVEGRSSTWFDHEARKIILEEAVDTIITELARKMPLAIMRLVVIDLFKSYIEKRESGGEAGWSSGSSSGS